MVWPLSLEGWQNLSGKDIRFSSGNFEHVLPSGRLVPNIMAFLWERKVDSFRLGKESTHKWISLTEIWNLTPNFSLCFKINDGNVKTLGYLPLNICNHTILYDWDEHEFTSHWNPEDYFTSSINTFPHGSNENHNTGKWKACVFTLHGTKNMVNDGKLNFLFLQRFSKPPPKPCLY